LKKTAKLTLYISLAILVIVSIYCCSSVTRKNVRIGIILPESGLHASFGTAQKRGYELAMEDLEKDSRAPGAMSFKVIFMDDSSDERKAVQAARKLTGEDHVAALIGSYSSATTFNAIEIANYQKVPMLIPSAASDEITGKGFPWIFRINAPSSVYAKNIIDYIKSLKSVKTLAILHENSLFGVTAAKCIDNCARSGGLRILCTGAYDEKDSQNIPLQLERIRKANPDGLITVSYLEDSVAIMKKCREMQINPKLYFGTGAGFTLNEFIRRTEGAAEYVFTVSQWHTSLKTPGNDEFVKRFQEKYNEAPTFHSVETYAALKIMAQAIRNAGSGKHDDIRNALLALDTETAYGRVKFENFDGMTNQNRHEMVVLQIQGGKYMLLWPESSSNGKANFPTPPWNERNTR